MYLTYDELKELKVGDTFCEEVHGFRFRFKVITPPKESSIVIGGKEFNQIRWTANNKKNDTIFVVTEGNEHYGPQITR